MAEVQSLRHMSVQNNKGTCKYNCFPSDIMLCNVLRRNGWNWFGAFTEEAEISKGDAQLPTISMLRNKNTE